MPPSEVRRSLASCALGLNVTPPDFLKNHLPPLGNYIFHSDSRTIHLGLRLEKACFMLQ